MSDNNSAPGFIIYFNRTKIPPERAAEVKRIIIIDRLNASSSFVIKVADCENEWSENDDYYIGSEVEILMGYDGELESIMTGEVTGFNCHMKRNQANEVTIKGNSHLHRLARCKINKAYYDMTVKDIITEIADGAGMKAEVDELSYQHVFTLQNNKTSYEYLFQLADYYDCYFWVDNKTLYFKKLKQNMAEDVVLEYGKTLLEILPESNTSRIVSEVEVKVWNPAKLEAISATATFSDIDSRGGSVVDDVFGGAISLHLDPNILDQKTADQRAIDFLELNNRYYVKGTGATYGNTEIRAGKIIKAEGLGEKFSGKYLVILAKHVLVPLRGYRTSFEFISSLGTPAQAAGGAETASTKQPGEPKQKEETQAAAATGAEEEQEEEKEPKIINLKWMKDDEEITQALVDDEVKLTAEVQDIDDGAWLRVFIWEKDDIGENDLISKKSCQIKDGKIEIEWKVKYVPDTDDTESEEEEKELGYTLPEYVFTVEKIAPEIKSEESPLLEVRGWIRIQMKDEKTKEPVANRDYIIYLTDDTEIEGTTDENGYIEETELQFGKYYIFLKDEEEEEK